ncbi:MAG: acyl--CoA ligase [Bacteroidales bacterium]|nr:acyl--CoA ligase [Bacteroidales bacterium]
MKWIEYVAHVVECYPDDLALICHGEKLTYAQLWTAAKTEAQRLRETEHLRAGQYYYQSCTQDIAYVVRFIALHLIGTLSDILYTTGSTGKPKAVLLSEKGMVANAENLIEAHGYHHGMTFVVCGPLDHFGPWSKMLPVFMTGATLHILDGLKDLESLFDALRPSHSATFLVPSAIRMLLQLNGNRLAALADSIEFIETGAAPMATVDMERLRELLPRTRLYNTYASTETGIVCTYPFHLSPAEGREGITPKPILHGCVGPMMKHAKVSIGPMGNICVSGPMLMAGYLNEDGEGNLQLDPVGEMFETADLGHFDDEGRLFLTGRSNDFINVGGLKLSPIEVEDAAAGYPCIEDCICIPEPHPMMGQVPKLLVTLRVGTSFNKRELASYLKEKLIETWKVPMRYEVVDEIRKMPNGKKNRRSYLTSCEGQP